MDKPIPSRRQFMAAIGELASAGWIAMNWPQIAFAAEKAGHDMKGMDMGGSSHTALTTLTAAEAAEVEAIANLIVPGGAKPGAKDARVIYFIDNALGSFFVGQLPAFRAGLTEFTNSFCTKFCTSNKSFSAASEAMQTAWLHEEEKTPFFAAVRRLTVLGLIALPKYGGNSEYKGWNLLGVEDNHSWAPPFGFYDIDYPGFEPYPGTKPYTA